MEHQIRLVMVVDDDRITRHLLSHYIRASGEFDVVVCSGGSEAFELFKRQHAAFFAVITDLVMPEFDGYELSRNMRAFESLHSLNPTPFLA